MRRFIFAGTIMVAVVMATAGRAQAGVICTGCEYIGPVGTNIGTYNPANGDTGTFQNTGVPNTTVIDDRWVFTIGPAGSGSLSADFTTSTAFTGFVGALYAAGAPVTCTAGAPPQGCTAATLGAIVANDTDADPNRVETSNIVLAAGTYIFRLQGTAAGLAGTGAYSGQIGTFQVPVVPEPALLALLALGLGAAARRRKKS